MLTPTQAGFEQACLVAVQRAEAEQQQCSIVHARWSHLQYEWSWGPACHNVWLAVDLGFVLNLVLQSCCKGYAHAGAG